MIFVEIYHLGDDGEATHEEKTICGRVPVLVIEKIRLSTVFFCFLLISYEMAPSSGQTTAAIDANPILLHIINYGGIVQTAAVEAYAFDHSCFSIH